MDYKSFIATKARLVKPCGFAWKSDTDTIFPYQKDLVTWALRRGKAAIFADTGLGKTRMMLHWAHAVHEKTSKPVLILAPLAVAAQTVAEGARIGIQVTHAREPEQVQPGINITNYDRLHKFEAHRFGAIVLDESSILKSFTGSTRNAIIEAFAATPYKLACTATPAPNDFTELGNHAEFLGVMSRTEMLSTWFVHDGGSTQDWRLKGHATQEFWRWVSSWGAMVRMPSDLGYDDASHILPPLTVHEHVLPASSDDAFARGFLFAQPAATLHDQRTARRASIQARVAKVAELVAAEPNEPWVIWCELNDEGDAITAAIDGAVQVAGADSNEIKEARLTAFANGSVRVITSKQSICGWGLNWQHCARVAFLGIGHSFEGYYQAIRRNWRFGQKREVIAHIVTSEAEGAVLANLRRKEAEWRLASEEMGAHTRAFVRADVQGLSRQTDEYKATKKTQVPNWLKEGAA